MSGSLVLPSGAQHEIACGDQTAVIVEVGGGVRSYQVAGRDVLDGYGSGEMCTSGRGQVLAPWPNRLEDGSYAFDGRHHQVAIDDLDSQAAIHGLVRWEPWRVVRHDADRVVLEHTIHPRPGYPFSVDLRVDHSLGDAGLAVETSATNVGSGPCPFGLGHHPYLRIGDAIDDLTLRLPASRVIESDHRGLPRWTVPVDGADLDFRDGRRLAGTVLDHAFLDLERDELGRAFVELRADDGTTSTLWLGASFSHVMVFTGDPLPDVARRSIAIEPMTCAPNAFRTGEDVIRIHPGETVRAQWGLTARGRLTDG